MTPLRKCWLLLFLAIAFEVAGTTGMRALAREHPFWSLASASAGICLAYLFVARSMEKIPAGLVYAVWSGVGLAGIALLSWLLFDEAMPPLKLLGLGLVIWGVVVINLDKSPPKELG